MKQPYIKYLQHISLILIGLIIPAEITLSCGPTLAADESRFALFRQGLDSNSGLLPFNYSEVQFNYSQPDPAETDRKRNCAEWVAFCGKEVHVNDVYDVQYKITADSFLLAYKNNVLRTINNNTFMRWLLKKENHESLNYFLLAKKAESTQATRNSDPWDTSKLSILSPCIPIAVQAAEMTNTNIPVFLKERYTFQAIKMYYYGGDTRSYYADIHKLYNDHLFHSNSIVAGWSLVYCGMSEYNRNKRTALLLEAFDKTEEKKEFSYLQITRDDLSALEKITADTNLLLLANVMMSIKNRGKALDQLRNVYQINSSSKYLPLLITREINKLENWLWSPDMLYFTDNYRHEFADSSDVPASAKEKLYREDRQYLGEVLSFVENIAAKNKSQSAFIQLALVHLYNLQRQFVKADGILKNMQKHVNSKIETQRLIEEVITTANTSDIMKSATKQKLASIINDLIALNPPFKRQINSTKAEIWEHDENITKDNELSELFILLSHKFEKAGDVVTAGLLYKRANITVNNYDGGDDERGAGYGNIDYYDRYASPDDIDKLIEFKHQKNKTQFEKLISPLKWGMDDQYKDLKGTILFRQKRFSEALLVFQNIDPDFWRLHYEFKNYLPLTTVTHTGKMIPSEKTIPSRYNKPSKALIVKDIVTILDKIPFAKNNAEKALLYYKLGNAYFNTSYNGKAWMMFSYGKSDGEHYKIGEWNYNWAFFNFYPNSLKYADYYYRCTDAIEMYKKSLSLTADRESAAKCLLALAVCDRIKHNYTFTQRAAWSDTDKDYHSKYLQKLKTEYGNTYAYREAAIACPDVKQ